MAAIDFGKIFSSNLNTLFSSFTKCCSCFRNAFVVKNNLVNVIKNYAVVIYLIACTSILYIITNIIAGGHTTHTKISQVSPGPLSRPYEYT